MATATTRADHSQTALGPWKLNRQTSELYTDPGDSTSYHVDLDDMLSSAEVLDTICQVAAKEWADHETIAGLVRAFCDILNPQANLCPWGTDRQLTPADIRRLAAAYRPEQP